MQSRYADPEDGFLGVPSPFSPGPTLRHQGTGLSSSNDTVVPFSGTQTVSGSDPICSVLYPSEFQRDPGTVTGMVAAQVLLRAVTVMPVMTLREKSMLYDMV
jgi:hypothetical protein